MISRLLLGLLAVSFLSGCHTPGSSTQSNSREKVEFVVTADIREFSDGKYSGNEYFSGVCKAIRRAGKGDFMLSPGDIDPPEGIRSVLDRSFGADYLWFPVVGNHEAETPADMQWLRAWGARTIPGLVRRGPPGCETTTFSFDRGPVHFVVLNQYFDGVSDYRGKGDMVDALYNWLKKDLEESQQPIVLVIGHEPILPLPDMDNGRLRHEKDSLNAYPENCRRFKDLLVEKRVVAYLCAHTHNASAKDIGGIWQLDAGHARGKGDLGAPSTFLRFNMTEDICKVDFFRQAKTNAPYKRSHSLRIPNPR